MSDMGIGGHLSPEEFVSCSSAASTNSKQYKGIWRVGINDVCAIRTRVPYMSINGGLYDTSAACCRRCNRIS
jgi:hypothetical protein